jgi:hypothetical protein
MSRTVVPAIMLIGLIGLVIAAIFGGVVADQKRHFYRCRLEAAHNYPRPNDPNDVYSDLAVYVENCMGATGFEIEYRPNDNFCRIGDDHRRLMNFCYAPMGQIARWLYHTEELLSR